MSWHWVLLIIILSLGNFLMLGSALIGLTQTPAVLISGGDIKYRGTSRYLAGTIVAFLLQSIAAATLSALIISYLYFITQGKGNVFMWIIGAVGAIYPMWQAWRLSNYARKFEPEAYFAKEATHPALIFSLLVTIICTFLFIFIPSFLNAVFYWLVGLWAFAGVVVVISIIVMWRKLKTESGDY